MNKSIYNTVMNTVMNKSIYKVIRLAGKLVNKMKPFSVACNYGTSVKCWSLLEARSWLTCCGPVAVIGQRGVVIEQRIQSRSNSTSI